MTVDRCTVSPTRPRVAPGPGVWLALLGGLEISTPAGPLGPGASARRLLALIAIHGPTTRADAAGVLWPEVSDAQALACLRTTLWRAGRCGAPLLRAAGDRLDLAREVEVDLHAFRGATLRLVSTRFDDADMQAFRSVQGELLPGWYDEWVLTERERVRQLRLHGWEVLAAELSGRGRYAGAIDAALHAVELEPLRESAHRVLVETHLREGNLVEAQRSGRAYTELLRDELGAAPSPAFAGLLGRVGIRE